MKHLFTKKWRTSLLIAAAALILTSVVSGREDDSLSDSPEKAELRSQKTANPAEESVEPLDLERLHRTEYSEVTADIFAADNPSPSLQASALPSSPPAAVAPAPPPLPFTFLGKLVDGEVVTVFLEKQGQNIGVKEHDVLDGTYRIEQINEADITISYLPMNIQQTLYMKRSSK